MAVRCLPPEVARKIAAGEVIDRPAAIVREFLDNAVDSGARSISVEIEGGGIERIRVLDDGCGMSKEDLLACARPHATSKISSEDDLLRLSTLGFRGEALSSIAAVSRLSIHSGTYIMRCDTEHDHELEMCQPVEGTIAESAGLFENFPARRVFLKRPSTEAQLCRQIFLEKALPRTDITFRFTVDGAVKYTLAAGVTSARRLAQCLKMEESEDLLYEIGAAESQWSFRLVLGEPALSRPDRKDISIYVNGRRIQEFSLVQAIEFGCQGYFPNGTHPVAALFAEMDPALVDFNIHPAKREARFRDISGLHHGISSATANFFRSYTLKKMNSSQAEADESNAAEPEFDFAMLAEQALNSAGRNFGGNFPKKNPAGAAGVNSLRGKSLPPKSLEDSGESGNSVFKYANPISSENAGSSSVEFDENPKGDSSSSGSAGRNIAFTNSYGRGAAYGTSATTSFAGRLLAERDAPAYMAERDSGGFRFIGQALGTFIIIERNGALYFIDQHAAHERLRFDAIMDAAKKRQPLLVPYVIEAEDEGDDEYLRLIRPELEKAGYTIEEAGGGKWEVSAVPCLWHGTAADLQRDLLEMRLDPKSIVRAIAASAACRGAVMDGDLMDSGTAERLALDALALPDPHCPHGRPVWTVLTKAQLFAQVKRT